MDFGLNEDQRLLQSAARKFAKEVLRPTAMKVEAEGGEVPSDMIQHMAELGYRGLDIPQEYGGLGFSCVDCAVIIEELVYGWFSASTYATNLGSGPILYGGSEAQKQKYLPMLSKTAAVSSFAITEEGAGSDASQVQTSARRDAGDYILNGRKLYITNAHRADIMVLFARSDINAPRGKGISLFIVERGTPGFSIGQRFRGLAHEANPIWEVNFDNCRVPLENRIGEEGEAFRYIQTGFSKSRAIYAIKCVGHAQSALDYALAFASQRQQFGRPISSFQGIRFKVADLVTKIESARLMAYRACQLADEKSEQAPTAAAMAKHLASNVAMEVAADAIQIMGGHGYVKDHPVERFYREAKLFQIGDGSSEVLRVLISRYANKCAADDLSVRL